MRTLGRAAHQGSPRSTPSPERSGLSSIGGGYFTAREGASEIPAQGTVYQGQLESSNVSSMNELVSMITVQRSFESANRLVQMINRTYERLLQQRIG